MTDSVVERVTAADVLLLRAEVLRPGLPLEASHYAQDDDEHTQHLAVRLSDGNVVGCATYFADPWPADDPPGVNAPVDGLAWRLRGMATSPEVRGTGVGGLLLARGIEVAGEQGARLLWCNARTVALGFYSRYDFRIEPAGFPSGPQNVPHHRAWRPVGDAASDVTARP